MDSMYKYLKQEVNEPQIELNTLNDVAESFFPPESSPGFTRRNAQQMRMNLTTEHDASLVVSQRSPLVSDSS